jgi:hypothetical protein
VSLKNLTNNKFTSHIVDILSGKYDSDYDIELSDNKDFNDFDVKYIIIKK